MDEMEKIRLGISTCLLGENVRYDGGHKWDRYLTDTLGKYVEYVSVCPEVEAGLGVPRPPLHLVGDPSNPRLVTLRTKQDLTDLMVNWAEKRVRDLEGEKLNGFIFKSNSPSSGMERVKVYDRNGVPAKKGVGVFARIFMGHLPSLPVEDEGRLHDPQIRENFVERIFTLKRWRVGAENPSLRGLIEFHTKNKLLILSHSPRHYEILGKFVAKGKGSPLRLLYSEYERILMESLRLKATPKKNANVLQHMMGYFKERLSGGEKKELLEIIDLHRRELVPLIAPITLMNHYVRKYDQPYLKEQTYLQPHPLELQLRHHV